MQARKMGEKARERGFANKNKETNGMAKYGEY
jgi:hypothetical protein